MARRFVRTDHPKLYAVWDAMKQRCGNPKNPSFCNYGARGIHVCPEWMSFGPFMHWALAAGYTPGLSLERMDNDGGYNPGNCKWATRKEQQRNTRAAARVPFQGRLCTYAELAEHCAIGWKALRERIHTHGWTVERAMSTPVRPKAAAGL